MNPTWKTLENRVRLISSLKWNTQATQEHLGGIDFDAVLRPSDDELILIEISERDDLGKIREDCIKINAFRLQKLADGVLCKGYIIIKSQPTNSMVETGENNKVRVLSVKDFVNIFFNHDGYLSLRSHQPFGSALNPFTGERDNVEYIPVRYQLEDKDIKYDANQIVSRLLDDDRLLLVGDYGTGKSRCIEKAYELLTTTKKEVGRYVISINLREHWGASSASEIIAGHLEELGMSGHVDNAMQIINSGGCILLLDGVDEVGAQLFGQQRRNRTSIRRAALSGVRKLVSKNKGGVLITSRSHYFDSDDEMLDCLGLSLSGNTKILRCADEFTNDESIEYLRKINVASLVPDWLPKKPLIFQVLSTLNKSDVEKLLASESGEFDFWGKFLSAISIRESRIHGSLDSGSVRDILIRLAELTRGGNEFLGRLTVKMARDAYEFVTADTPDEAGEQMLMRLCTLGRISPATPERQFVDAYIVDGFRAEALINNIDRQDRYIANETWKQPLGRLGWHLLWGSLEKFKKEALYKAMLGALKNGVNNQAYAEIVSSLLVENSNREIDAENHEISDVDIYWMNVGNRRILGLTIKNSFIRNLEIEPEKKGETSSLHLDDCQVFDLYGVSSVNGMPDWINRTDVERFDSVSTASRIKDSSLRDAQVVFLALVHKIFFQPGKGRQENALFKGGYGKQYEPKLIKKMIALLLTEGIIEKSPGDDGVVYKPVRTHTRRMAKIKGELTLSDDPLWIKVSGMN